MAIIRSCHSASSAGADSGDRDFQSSPSGDNTSLQPLSSRAGPIRRRFVAATGRIATSAESCACYQPSSRTHAHCLKISISQRNVQRRLRPRPRQRRAHQLDVIGQSDRQAARGKRPRAAGDERLRSARTVLNHPLHRAFRHSLQGALGGCDCVAAIHHGNPVGSPRSAIEHRDRQFKVRSVMAGLVHRHIRHFAVGSVVPVRIV